MAFNADEFIAAKFERRTKVVNVPELKDWFDEGEDAVWTVQSLTGNEIAKADEIASRRSISAAILEGLITMRAQDVKEAIKKMVGKTDDITETTAKRMQHLIFGSVSPPCNEDLAVKLNDRYPTVFISLTNEILRLSGQGKLSPGKSKPFGKAKKSKQH